MSEQRRINPRSARRVGLWRVRAVPYLYKDRWTGAPFGDRWRALKTKTRTLQAVAGGAS